MKYAVIVLGCFLGLAQAQEEPPKEGEKPAGEGAAGEGGAESADDEDPPSKPPEAPPDEPGKIISDLTLANAAKDVPRIDLAAKQALRWAPGAKDEGMIETMAKELSDSLRAAKGNWGTLNVVMQAIGELRSKEGAKTLKKHAFKKDAKDENEEKLQATAIIGLGKFADPKELAGFEEASKSNSKIIAKAAYEALGLYGHAKAKVRKQCAEVLMKRVDMEYPSSGGQGGKSVSAEKQERWTDISPVIINSMKNICGEETKTLNDIDNWREWWKENKKKPWKDEGDDKES